MPRPKGHPLNSPIGTLGNVIRWANVEDRSAATEPARQALRDKFVREARERWGDDLPEAELNRKAEYLRREFYIRMSLKAAAARRRKAKRNTSGGDLDDAA